MSIEVVGDNLETALNEINNDTDLVGEADVRVFRYPPDQISALPSVVFWVESGTSQYRQPKRYEFHTWTIDFITSRQSAQHAAERAEKYIQPLIKALRDSTDLCINNQGADGINYEVIAYEYAGKPVFGYRYSVEMFETIE